MKTSIRARFSASSWCTFGAAGAVLGAVLALILDRRSVTRQQRVVVESVPDSEPDTDPQP